MLNYTPARDLHTHTHTHTHTHRGKQILSRLSPHLCIIHANNWKQRKRNTRKNKPNDAAPKRRFSPPIDILFVCVCVDAGRFGTGSGETYATLNKCEPGDSISFCCLCLLKTIGGKLFTVGGAAVAKNADLQCKSYFSSAKPSERLNLAFMPGKNAQQW